jgi:uncharacterized protein YbaP (TraB family)
MQGNGWAVIGRHAATIIAPLLLIGLAGCSDVPGASEAERPAPSPLLYEIASADGTVEGWMLGTIHALPDGIDWRTPAIGRVMDRADLLVVEVGELKGRGEGPAIYFSLAHSPGNPPLAERVPAGLRQDLAALIKRGGIESHDFSVEETWAAALTLARIDAPGKPANGVDAALIEEFSGERPVRELEGLRGQLSIFDRLPEAQQRAMLAAVVRESAKAGRDPERLLRAWLAGDAATIEASTQEGFLADPPLREALLAGRNRRWAAALEPMLREKPRPLIAVGTAHLVGPDGLAALFEAQGYRVRPIPTLGPPAP